MRRRWFTLVFPLLAVSACADDTAATGAGGSPASLPAGDVVTQLFSAPGEAACASCLRAMSGVTDANDGSGPFDCAGVVAACGANDETCGALASCIAGAGAANPLCAFEACLQQCSACYGGDGSATERFFHCAQIDCSTACDLNQNVCPNYD